MRISRCKIACMRGNNWIFLSCSLGNILSYFSFGCWWNEKKKAEKMGREIGMKGKKSKRQRIAINAIHVHVNGEKRGTAYDDVWRIVTFFPKFMLWTVYDVFVCGEAQVKKYKMVYAGECVSGCVYVTVTVFCGWREKNQRRIWKSWLFAQFSFFPGVFTQAEKTRCGSNVLQQLK